VQIRTLGRWVQVAATAARSPVGEIAVSSLAGNANGVLVVTRDSTGAATVDRPFHLIVSC
jgi:hypothetical protein